MCTRLLSTRVHVQGPRVTRVCVCTRLGTNQRSRSRVLSSSLRKHTRKRAQRAHNRTQSTASTARKALTHSTESVRAHAHTKSGLLLFITFADTTWGEVVRASGAHWWRERAARIGGASKWWREPIGGAYEKRGTLLQSVSVLPGWPDALP